MSLILPPFGFAHTTSSISGTPPAVLIGTSFTAGASNSNGSAVEVLSALTHDVHYLVVAIGGVNLSSGNGQGLLDILVDRAGGTSWSSFIDDLVCGFTDTPVAGTTGIELYYHFPIWLPAGSSIGVRCQTRHGQHITTGRVVMHAYGDPSRADAWWCGQGVESLGINTAVSQGTDVTPGNSGAWGSWATIGTSTARYGAVQWATNGSDNSSTAIGYYWQLGIGDAQLPGSQTGYTSNSTAEIAARTGFAQPIWCNVPAGTDWQVRGTASGTAEVHNAAVYGVY